MVQAAREPRTRGHRKRERTRRQLLEAGLRVLAAKGQGLSVSDVVAEAEVSNGTFYNYFDDREQLLAALAEHSALSLAAAAAGEPVQFERNGYFCADPLDSAPGAPVFNRTVALRDTWAKIEKRAGGGSSAGR